MSDFSILHRTSRFSSGLQHCVCCLNDAQTAGRFNIFGPYRPGGLLELPKNPWGQLSGVSLQMRHRRSSVEPPHPIKVWSSCCVTSSAIRSGVIWAFMSELKWFVLQTGLIKYYLESFNSIQCHFVRGLLLRDWILLHLLQWHAQAHGSSQHLHSFCFPVFQLRPQQARRPSHREASGDFAHSQRERESSSLGKRHAVRGVCTCLNPLQGVLRNQPAQPTNQTCRRVASAVRVLQSTSIFAHLQDEAIWKEKVCEVRVDNEKKWSLRTHIWLSLQLLISVVFRFIATRHQLILHKPFFSRSCNEQGRIRIQDNDRMIADHDHEGQNVNYQKSHQ